MFNTISWQEYWTVLAISSALYYCFIFLFYYRNDVKAFLLKRSSGNFSLHEDHPDFQQPPENSEERVVYGCMDELNAFFEEAKRKRWQKNELIYSLQQVMKKYPSIRTSGYKQSVSNVLHNQCEHICNIHISAEELEHVWLGA